MQPMKDTTGPRKCVLIRKVFLFQRLICTQMYTIGTSENGSENVCTYIYLHVCAYVDSINTVTSSFFTDGIL